MIIFSNWNISTEDDVLGYQYDNHTRVLMLSGDMPDGYSWDALVEANGNFNIIPLSATDNGFYALLDHSQLAIAGRYTIQLRGTHPEGSKVRHTNFISVRVCESLSGDANWPTIPSELTQLEERVQESRKAAEDAANGAGQSEQSATGAAVESKSWAVGGTESRPDEETNNARYWSRKAQAAAEQSGGTAFVSDGVKISEIRASETKRPFASLPVQSITASESSGPVHGLCVDISRVMTGAGKRHAPMISYYSAFGVGAIEGCAPYSIESDIAFDEEQTDTLIDLSPIIFRIALDAYMYMIDKNEVVCYFNRVGNSEFSGFVSTQKGDFKVTLLEKSSDGFLTVERIFVTSSCIDLSAYPAAVVGNSILQAWEITLSDKDAAILWKAAKSSEPIAIKDAAGYTFHPASSWCGDNGATVLILSQAPDLSPVITYGKLDYDNTTKKLSCTGRVYALAPAN